jgi:hypothetical protein
MVSWLELPTTAHAGTTCAINVFLKFDGGKEIIEVAIQNGATNQSMK